MKCEKHPETDAVGACVSCGRGVCPICKISYNNMMHCKECIEAGRVGGHAYASYWAQPTTPGMTPGYGATTPGTYGASTGATTPYAGAQPGQQAQAVYPYAYGGYPSYGYYGYPYTYGTYGVYKAQAQPKGVPNGALFKIGTAGCIITAIMGFVMGISILNTGLFGSSSGGPQNLVLASILLMMAMFPFGLGIFGFYKNYGSSWGLMGSLSVLISSVLYPVLLYMSILNSRSSDYFNPDYMYIFLAHMSLGVGLIMAALAIYQAKRFFEVERQVQGITGFASIGLAIAGLLFTAIVGMYLIGWIAMGVSLFMISIEFYHAPVPTMPEDEAKADLFTTDQAKKPGATAQAAPVQQKTPEPAKTAYTAYSTNPTYEAAPPSRSDYPEYTPPSTPKASRTVSETISEEENWDVQPVKADLTYGKARKL